MADEVGVAILGTGFAGRVHALAARGLGARLVGVAGSIPPVPSGRRGRLRQPSRASLDAADLIDHPAVEVVHVCTLNALHVPLAEMALEAGKHVICEKPLATTAEDATRLASLARAVRPGRGRLFRLPLPADGQKARDRVRRGEIGPVRLVHGSYLQDWLLYETDGNWRTGSKENGRSRAFADIGSHWCDIAEWITGRRITELAALTSTVHERRARPRPFGAPAGSEDGAVVSSRHRGRRLRRL